VFRIVFSLFVACLAAQLGGGEGLAAGPDRSALSKVPGWIVYDSKRDGQFDIYKMRPDGSRVTRLTDSPDWETMPDWSPDGKSIVYTRKGPGDDDTTGDIWIMDADGGNQRRLTRNGSAPQFTPDGEWVIFQRDRTALIRTNVHISEERTLTPPPNVPFPWHMTRPQISPDGKTVAFISDRNGRWHAWTLDMEGNARLIDKGCEPTWAPDGRKIYYMRDVTFFVNAIWVKDWPDGEPREFLTLQGTYSHAYFPSVSSDGKWLLFSACPAWQHDHTSAHYQVFIKPLDGGAPIRLSENDHTERWPRLSTKAP
jgi:Tol biopolymer transport system component